MKRVFNAFINDLCKETGYDYDFLVEKYNEAVDSGVTVVDFVDNVLDSTLFSNTF